MVDASVGGKTGFDHPTGKNLLGAFHQPSGVVVDLAHLSTLPARERIAGLAEVVKIALAADAPLLDLLERDAAAVAAGDLAVLAPIVRRAIEAKVRIVRDDERETGRRAILNLGHTLGHAVEAQGRYRKHLHGEAVALGTLGELAATARMGWTPAPLVERTRELMSRLGLPVRLQRGEAASALSFVASDKKRVASRIRLPVVRSAGEATLELVEITALREAILSGDG
jgi:shikimate kinase/3-dehydroquinate synthase